MCGFLKKETGAIFWGYIACQTIFAGRLSGWLTDLKASIPNGFAWSALITVHA